MDEAMGKMDDLRNQTGEYSDVPSYVYYNEVEKDVTFNGVTFKSVELDWYGLERGETADKSSDYTYMDTWVSPTKIDDEKISSLYTNNPDENQFWPIWQVFIDSSNGMLTND